jgi:3-oxoadipate enol-lactonase
MDHSGHALVNGQNIYFEVHGVGHPVVLIMGIGYDSTLWHLQQLAALSEHFKVIIFDNRDAGRSGAASYPYTIADMADDVAGLLDALAIDRADVLGLSMGALIAEEFAIRYGARLNRLVLCGPDLAPARHACHPIEVWNWVKAHDESSAVFAAQQFTWLFSSAYLRNHAAVQQTLTLLAGNPNPVTIEGYARQARAYLAYDPGDRLGSITAPTLVIVGEQDLLTPPWIAAEVASAIPDAQLKIIAGEGASHLVALERAEEFNGLVTAFLAAPVGFRELVHS